MRIIPVKRRRGTLVHAVTEGAESPRETMCGRPADGADIADDPVTCTRCLREIAALGWN